MEEAAGVMCFVPVGSQINPFTAYGLLETAAPPAGSWIIQSAAGSVLGRMLIALAKKRGVRVVNLVRRSAQIQELLDLG